MADPRIDSVSERYFRPLRIAEAWSDWLFIIGAILSFAAFAFNKEEYPRIYYGVQIAFILAVASLSLLGIVIRVYFFPRAYNKRFQGFLGEAFGVKLNEEVIRGYYNTNATGSRRIAALLLENSFHTKNILAQMCRVERVKFVVYWALFVVAILVRQTNLEFLAIAAQALFSEQIVSKLARTEWLRSTSEKVYEETFRLLRTDTSEQFLQVLALDFLFEYEAAKANAAITLSEKVFKQLRDPLNSAWENIRHELNI